MNIQATGRTHVCIWIALHPDFQRLPQSGRVSQSLNGDLYFSNVLREDSRNDYTCYARFPHTQTIQQKQPINVRVINRKSKWVCVEEESLKCSQEDPVSVCVCVYSKCVCRWLCRRGTVFPISNPVLREASGCPPTEKTYCGQSRWRPAVSANQALIAVRRTRLRQQRHLVMVLRPRLLPPCFYVVWFDFIFQFLCFIEVNFCQTWLLFYLFFTRVLSVWFLCCVTVDAINDTIPAFYNDTDLFSGEFLPPRSSHSSQCLWRPPCLSELLLLPH